MKTCQIFTPPYPLYLQGTTLMPHPTPVPEFIRRWQASGAAERTNFPQFAVELGDILHVPIRRVSGH